MALLQRPRGGVLCSRTTTTVPFAGTRLCHAGCRLPHPPARTLGRAVVRQPHRPFDQGANRCPFVLHCRWPAAARRLPAALRRPAGHHQRRPLSGCAAKAAAIEAKLETARSFANEGQVAGLEKPLRGQGALHRSRPAEENKQKVIDSEREVSEREKDLRKAMGKGDPEKIEKQAKLAEARRTGRGQERPGTGPGTWTPGTALRLAPPT